MGKKHAARYIREHKDDTRSIDEQIEISHALWDEDFGPGSDGLKRTEIEDELGLDLDYQPGTSLDHLVEIEMVEEFQRPGPDTLVIATWLEDGVINGEVGESAVEGVEALIADMDDEMPDEGSPSVAADGAGTTIRAAVADQFDLEPHAVEEHLRTGDPVDKLNGAVEAIEDDENDLGTGDDYGSIIFINQAYRYRLTTHAVGLYEE